MFRIPGVEAIAGALVTAALCWALTSWWLIPQAERNARAGYVLEVRALSAEALAAELERQTRGQQVVIDAYQQQYKNALVKQAELDEQAEKSRVEYEALKQTEGRAGGLTQSDIDFLRKQRTRRAPAGR